MIRKRSNQKETLTLKTRGGKKQIDKKVLILRKHILC